MQLKNFKQIFADKYFIIPAYQRGYSWEVEKQVKDFWNDLIETKIEQNHYVSQITLKPKLNSKGACEYECEDECESDFEIIDGQQRITTTIILLQCIYNKALSTNSIKQADLEDLYNSYIYDKTQEKFKFSYDKDNPSDEYFKLKILGINNHGGNTPQPSLHTINLSKAKTFFETQIDEYLKNSEHKLNSLIHILTHCFLMNEYILDDTFNIYAAFESMNNRGKPLSTLELLKNRFFFLIPYFNLHNDNKINNMHNLINNAYNNIYQNLAKNETEQIEDDYFLRNHWLCYKEFAYNRSQAKVFKEELLNEIFTKKAISKKDSPLTDIYTNEYIKDLALCSEYFYIIHNPYSLNDKEYSDFDPILHNNLILYLNKLNRLGFANFKPLIMKALKLYMLSNTNKNTIVDLIQLIEKFIFITFGLCGYSITYINNKLYHLAKSLNSMEDIEPTISFIKKIMDNGNDGSSNGGTYKNNKLNLVQFKKYNNIDGNFYKWSHYLKYLLYEYEYFLATTENNTGNKTFNHTQYIAKDKAQWVEIEHILPQTFDASKWSNFNQDSHYKNLNLLGNLLLLNKNENIKATNNSFEDKKTIYIQDSESSKKVAKEQQWNEKQILNRAIDILNFANKQWDLKLSDEVITQIADGSFFVR